jgi:RNA polymerase sigma-70 factor (ECF subfamily)
MAEDLVQEVFLIAYRQWPQFRGESKISTWLFRIAARTCSRMQRKRAGEPDRMESLEEMLPSGQPRLAYIPGPDEEPLDREIREEGRRAVQAAIAALPEAFRMPIVLREIVGFSLAEIAQILEVPEATIKTRLHRARLKLRHALEQAVPQKEVPGYSLERALCVDLLHAKQACLDHHTPFEFPNGIFCERCEVVFRSLDLTQELCRLEEGHDWPQGLEKRILSALEAHA